MPKKPEAGLYDPRFERDSCGFGLFASIDNEPSHRIGFLPRVSRRWRTIVSACNVGQGHTSNRQLTQRSLPAVIWLQGPTWW